MNTIKIYNDEIVLNYPDREETWVRSTSSIEYNDFISYDGYTYIMKKSK